MGQKFWVKKIFGKKILGQKNFRFQNIFESKKFLWVKNFLALKNYGSKIFWVKICGQKKCWSKKPGSEFFLSKNNQVRLTQGGGYMTPPP